jgi:3-hydroxyisobutyrate dehydrogenase
LIFKLSSIDAHPIIFLNRNKKKQAIMTSPLNIAFAGLGAMGFGMASHLLKLGHNVTGYDVYEPSLAKFREVGGQTASSPRQAAQGSDFLICMVANAQQAESVLFDSDNGAVQGT